MDADRGVRIDAVRDGAGLKAFIDIPWRVFAGDPAWVPPLKKERAEVLDRNKNPFFQHAEVELFTAWVDGRPCGRISAQIDRRVSARHGADLGHFGFLDAVDSGPVFDGLLNAAEAWLEARGVRRVRGLLFNGHEGGIVAAP